MHRCGRCAAAGAQAPPAGQHPPAPPGTHDMQGKASVNVNSPQVALDAGVRLQCMAAMTDMFVQEPPRRKKPLILWELSGLAEGQAAVKTALAAA